MKATTADFYRCPYTGETLELAATEASGDLIVTGELQSATGRRYRIADGVAHLIDHSLETFSAEESREIAYYQAASDTYDGVMDWLFASFHEDENRVREAMIDQLAVKPGDRVLETGCGTCRDSVRIARRIGRAGRLFLQDLSPPMLAAGRKRMAADLGAADSPETEFFVGNAAALPFPDGTFDAAFHFGGLNLFSDKARALREMARVVRIGGKVVVGDESLAPWLAETEYGKILKNSNQLYAHRAPIECVPANARDVCLRWLIGSAYYLIDFRVGDGEPALDLDRSILGGRGGTHRTRYYGRVEGVTPEAKGMVERAAVDSGLSLHDWLDRAIRRQFAAEKDGT